MKRNFNNINFTKISSFTIARKKIIPKKEIQEKMEIFFKSKNNSETLNLGDQDGDYAAIHHLPEFDWLTKEIEIAVIEYLSKLGYKTNDFSIFFQKSWTVITNPGGTISNHSHPNSLLSAVYYLQSEKDKGGCLIFNSDNSLFKGSIDNSSVNPSIEQKFTGLKPIKNSLVLFPSSLEHFVSIHKGEKPRWSITFDITITTSSKLGSARSENIMIHPKYWKEFKYNNLVKDNLQSSKDSFLKDNVQLNNFLSEGYLIIENFIDKSLCDLVFKESVLNLGRDPNFVQNNNDLIINNVIPFSEKSLEVVKKITKKLGYILKNFLLSEEDQFLTELGTIFSFPGSLSEELHRVISNRRTKFITIFLNLLEPLPGDELLTLYPGSHLKFPFDLQTSSKINSQKIILPRGSFILLDSRLCYFLNANTSKNNLIPLLYISYGKKNIEFKSYFIKDDLRGKYRVDNFL